MTWFNTIVFNYYYFFPELWVNEDILWVLDIIVLTNFSSPTVATYMFTLWLLASHPVDVNSIRIWL